MDQKPIQRLKKFRNHIAQLQPETQAIPYNPAVWEKRFANHPAYQTLSRQHPGTISRGDLFTLSKQAHLNPTKDNFLLLFVGTMLWGYGRTGYGAYRTAKMLATPNALETIQQTGKLIGEGKILQAYWAFNLKWCGSAFFTKFFYFLGMSSDIHPKPLILDSVVLNSLVNGFHLDPADFAHYSTNQTGRITFVGRYPEGYLHYVETMNQWAENLDCRPDAIELFLFDPPEGFLNSE